MEDNKLTYEDEVFVYDDHPCKNFKYYRNYLKLIVYSIVYDVILYLFPLKNSRKEYEISLCTIFKNEAPFLKEWLEYHLLMGVEHFYMYNNNSDDNYVDILKPYIEKNIVTLIQWPDVPGQLSAYTHFYNNYRQETKWVSFLDVDEFFCPTKEKNISSWLKKYDKYPIILVYWKMFGTSGKLKHDYDRLVIEQYTISWNKLDSCGKLFWNTNYDTYLHMGMHHYNQIPYKRMLIPPINVFGYFVKYGIHRHGKRDIEMQCNHYWSKAWDTFEKKHERGSCAFGKSWRTFDKFLLHENHNISSDNTIFRFILQLKLVFYGK